MSEFENIEIVSWSPEMIGYLKETGEVIENLHKAGLEEQFFDRSLLLSMDDGWGTEEFVECIKETISVYYEVPLKNVYIRKVEVPTTREVDYWKERVATIRSLSNSGKGEKEFSIALIDLRDWMSEIQNPILLEAVEEYGQVSQNVMLVFWIPRISDKALEHIGGLFAKKTSIYTLSVAPITIDKQCSYMNAVLEKKGFSVKKDSKEAFTQWVSEKQAAGEINSLHSLENMCSELIFQKMKTKNEDRFQINKEDIQCMQQMSKNKDDAYLLLDELIGMPQVKEKVKEVVAQIKLQKEMSLQGKKVEMPATHMLFLGNPGTGKTTVARIVGKIFQQEGILRIGDFQETTGNNFVEGNVANTVAKVRGACKSARGSVLFIDEAYGMAVGHSNGNNADNVVPVFVAEMENHRDDMCLIFAGYEDEMNVFLDTNSGLKSRIPHVIKFPNYNKDELVQIFFQMLEGSFEYEEGLKKALEGYLESVSKEKFESKEFGNGRFVRNLYERVWGKAAYRINFTEDKEVILRVEDLNSALSEEMFASMVDKKEKRIGFQIN